MKQEGIERLRWQAAEQPDTAVKCGWSGYETQRKRDWMLLAIPGTVLLLIALMFVLGLKKTERLRYNEPLDPVRLQTMNAFQAYADKLETQVMTLRLCPDEAEAGETYELKLPASLSRVRVDMNRLEHDLRRAEAGTGKCCCMEETVHYLSLDRAALWQQAEELAERCNRPFLESFVRLESSGAEAEEGSEQVSELLLLNKGQTGQHISKERLYFALLIGYYTGNLTPSVQYSTSAPKPLNVEEIWKTYCTEPQNASLGETPFSIIPDVPGYGVERGKLQAALEALKEGETLSMEMQALSAEITEKVVEREIFPDVIAEVRTFHSMVEDRTANLVLACGEINGTTLMPGEVFSFNEVVGERTAEKGYREATAYVAGASVPEIGGGVCQVASSLYYAVLNADLLTLERHSHTYLVTYVPKGMDAAIYWGDLDYKFENSSPYPIRINASVSDGTVNVTLLGQEWKDYSVRLTHEVKKEIPYQTKKRLVTDGSYHNGEVIVSPYTGYQITSFMTKVDVAGNELETTEIATSHYNKRDEIVALVLEEDSQSATTPTETP